MKGLLLLFYEGYAEGARDSEKTFNPDITEVKVVANGIPNKIYSQGMKTRDFWGKFSEDLEKKILRWMLPTSILEIDLHYLLISEA